MRLFVTIWAGVMVAFLILLGINWLLDQLSASSNLDVLIGVVGGGVLIATGVVAVSKLVDKFF